MPATPVFYDTHAHLGFPDFEGDLAEVIARAAAAGIGKIITIGTDAKSSARAVKIAESYANVFAAVGWHPTHVMEAPSDVRPALRELARHPKVVAIGETGLDYHRRADDHRSAGEFDAYKARQSEIFGQQLELAVELGLNCVIHQRESFEDTLAHMRAFAGETKGVFHCFSESVAALKRVVELGCLVSFTGIVTFKNGQNARDALAAAPAGNFMLETDCPFLAPMPFRGQRCEPAHVREISQAAAGARQCSLVELSQMTNEAAHRFFPKLAGGLRPAEIAS